MEQLLDLMDEFPEPIARSLEKEVPENELTVLRLMGSRSQAIALTNRALYVLTRGLLSSRWVRIPLESLINVHVGGEEIRVDARGTYKVPFPKDKRKSFVRAAHEIRRRSSEARSRK